ncbi:putative phage abortive infection protein [Shewanella sp. FJAT-51649]|uniref:putative phage abortive infection protein n=1 Tax=Shewanella sp. FJAT-51649 TaxID=2864210 RepID=UPI001C656BE8|nr:putative phage abortive infection protein [Shewanella sp. FJAT-51649]QYJ70820.1 putative phage abortive infection protein [Shewanella sp. FJAT-51649]
MSLLEKFKSDKIISAIIVTGIFLTISIIIAFLWQDYKFDSTKSIDSEKIGQFGDFVGGMVGSLWSLAGVFLFYKALTEQRSDFKNNRTALDLQVNALNQQVSEFQLNREELKLNRRVYEEQAKTARIQQFESSFYSLINVYLKTREFLDSRDGGFFCKLTESIFSHYSQSQFQDQDKRSNLVNSFSATYNNKRDDLSRYFRTLYRIISTVDEAICLDNEEKFYYAKIIRSQLSDNELLLIYYNSHTFFGEKSRFHILRYNLLKHVPLLNTPIFKELKSTQNDDSLAIIYEFIREFLGKHYSKFYDVEDESEKIEEKLKDLSIIFGIYFEDDVNLKIYTSNDIKNNRININLEDFQKFLYSVIYELLVYQTYLLDEKIKIERSIITYDDSSVFCFKILTSEVININKDSY